MARRRRTVHASRRIQPASEWGFYMDGVDSSPARGEVLWRNESRRSRIRSAQKHQAANWQTTTDGHKANKCCEAISDYVAKFTRVAGHSFADLPLKNFLGGHDSADGYGSAAVFFSRTSACNAMSPPLAFARVSFSLRVCPRWFFSPGLKSQPRSHCPNISKRRSPASPSRPQTYYLNDTPINFFF